MTIVRMWESRVLPDKTEEIAAFLKAMVASLRTVDGCLGVEVFGSAPGNPSDDDRIVIISRWRDQAALASAAGPGWRTETVDADGESGLWARPPHVWHFETWPL